MNETLIPHRIRHWPLPARFQAFLLLLPAIAIATMPFVERWSQAVLVGFDAAALVFMLSLWSLTRDHTPGQMRAHARANDSGRLGMLLLSSLLMVVIVTAVVVELPHARHDQGPAHMWAMLLVLGSLVVAWLFSNLIYALHYAHLYYRGNDEGGLNFPAARDSDAPPHCPVFWDFVYVSLTIGMALATSDVEVTRSDIRRVAVVHGAAAFFYNLIVLAFTINVTAGG